MSSGRQGSRSPQELFSRGKNGFFSSHKVCIVAQRGALMSARGPRGADNLGSVPQAPYACHSPEGHKQSPAAKPLPFGFRHSAPSLLTNPGGPGARAPGVRTRAGPWGTKGVRCTGQRSRFQVLKEDRSRECCGLEAGKSKGKGDSIVSVLTC
jgi:hypothetical protein